MKTLIEEKKVENNTEKKFDINSYIDEHFSLEGEECKRKVCPIMGNNYRINFYQKSNPDSPFTDYFMNRSYFVIFEIVEDSVIGHKVL